MPDIQETKSEGSDSTPQISRAHAREAMGVEGDSNENNGGYPEATSPQDENTKKLAELGQRMMEAQSGGKKMPPADMAQVQALIKQMEEMNKGHKFWGSQPVPQDFESLAIEESGPIDANEDVKLVKQDPTKLPAGFEWEVLDLESETVRNEIYTLLYENYVEDDDAQFRFDYSIDFLMWALTPHGYIKDWHVGVRVSKSKKLVGMITGIPQRMRVHDKERDMCEINFLCVHKKLRSKRLAPVLIKEVTRRVNLKGIWQAVYTAGVTIPTPMAECRYYHRSINPKKLIEVGFSPLQPRMTIARTVK
eukprot:gene1116-1085_t